MAKKVNVSRITEENEISKLLKLIVIVSLVVLVFYAITLFVNKPKEDNKINNKTQIQYDNILVGNILTQPNKKYYVLAKISDDSDIVTYTTYLSQYKNQKDALRVYYTDLNNPLNSKFLKETSNFDINNITNISFKETTLLLIEDEKIAKVYEGNEKIIEILTEITKVDS